MSSATVHITRDFLILERLRHEWLVWLAFTTDLNPYENTRTPAARRADAAMCALINREEWADAKPCPKAELQ